MAYELKIDTVVTGQQALNSVEQVMGKIASTTKLSTGELKAFEYALKSGVTAGDSLNKVLVDISKSNESFSRQARDAAASMVQSTKAVEANVASVTKLKAAHQDLIPHMAATSGALRELNGAMPFRALERFVATTLGMGPILQAAFPVVGAIAMGEELLRLAGRTEPLKKAQEELAKSAVDLDRKYEQLGKRFERLQIETITDKFGKLAGANLAAFYAESSLNADKARIRDIGDQIDTVMRKLATTGAVDAAASHFAVGGATAWGARKILGLESSQSLNMDLRRLQGEQQFAKDSLPTDQARIDKDKADAAKDAAREAKAAGREAAAEAKRQAHELASINKELSGAGESAFARDSDRYTTGKGLAGNDPTKRGQLDQSYSKGYFQRIAKELEIEREKQARLVAKDLEDSRLEGPILAGRMESGELGGAKRDIRLIDGIAKLPKKIGPTSADQLRIDADRERVGVGQIQVSGQRGDELATAQRVAAFQISAVEKRRDLELSLANQSEDKERLQENARLDFEEKLFDIRSSLEDKIIEKRKANQQESVSSITGLIMSANGGGSGVSSYMKGFAQNLESKVLGNFLETVIKPGQFSLPGKAGELLKGTMFGAVPGSPTEKKIDTTNAWLQAIYGAVSGNPSVTDPAAAKSGPSGTATSFPGFGSGTVAGIGSIATGVAGGGVTGGLGALLGMGSKSTALSSGSTLSQVLSGFGHTGDVRGILTGVSSGPNGAESLSTSEQVGAGIGTAGVIYGGVRGVTSGIKSGGARGTIGAIGAAAGTAAALDPEPISKAILAGVALTSQIVTSFMGDPRANRSQQIFKELGNAKFNEPVALNESADSGGHYADVDRFGNVRTSSLSPTPTVSQPGQYYRNGVYEQIPGYVGTPYSPMPTPPAAGPTINVTIPVSTMDAKSFNDNSHLVIGAVHSGITKGQGAGLLSELSYNRG